MAAARALLEVTEAQEFSRRQATALEVGAPPTAHHLITCEVPRVSWGAFCEAFSGRYHRSLVTVEHPGRDGHSRLKPPPQRLAELSLEFSGRGCDAVHIFLSATSRSFHHLTVNKPAHVRLLKNESGADRALEIESADGAATVVRLCSPLLLDLVPPW